MTFQDLLQERVPTLETSQFEMGWLNWLASRNAVERDRRSASHERTTEEIKRSCAHSLEDIAITLETSQFEMGWLNWLASRNAVERDRRSASHERTTEEIQ